MLPSSDVVTEGMALFSGSEEREESELATFEEVEVGGVATPTWELPDRYDRSFLEGTGLDEVGGGVGGIPAEVGVTVGGAIRWGDVGFSNFCRLTPDLCGELFADAHLRVQPGLLVTSY